MRPSAPTLPPSARLVERTHDGLVLDFPRRPPTPLTVFFGLGGWIVVGWITLWLVAMPVAEFVEAQRWWDVNEAILTFRWLMIGLPIWPVLFTMAWLWVRGPENLRVKVDQHGFRWRSRFGWQRIAWADLVKVTDRSQRLALNARGGRVWLLPNMPESSVRALHDFVKHQWFQAHAGDTGDVPPAIRHLQRDAQRETAS